VTTRIATLRTALTSAILATGMAGIATAGTLVCDPMYPCVADGTPAAVYDLSARTRDATAPTAEGLEAELSRNTLAARSPASPAAVYDPAVRTDQAPCQSYPCYPEAAASATPIVGAPAAILRETDRRG
jgi:hypothetical protein